MSVSTLGSTSTAAPRQGRASWPPAFTTRSLIWQPTANATFPFFAAAFSNNWQQGYKEGMAMFINRQQDDTSGRTTITGRHRSHNIMASVPVLNYYLTVGSCDQTFVERYIKRYSLNEALIPHYPSDSGATRYLTDRLKKNYGSIPHELPIAGSGTLITDDVTTDPQLATWYAAGNPNRG